MYARFHPIEVDEKRSVAERREAMETWWEQAHELLLRQRVTRETFRELVKSEGKNVYFRDRTHELFGELKRRGVPLLIFSAGLGDLIDAVVEREQGWGAHAHVVSNHLSFAPEGEGVAIGFRHGNITTFSKNEAVLTQLHPVWESEVRNRRFAVVLGDSIGDAHMAEGVPHECVLTIGFLNRGQEESLAEYTAAFDVVLREDNTMDYLIELLAQIPD
jgi:HAD superfamily hydrolase (TIGR01544 family)